MEPTVEHKIIKLKVTCVMKKGAPVASSCVVESMKSSTSVGSLVGAGTGGMSVL